MSRSIIFGCVILYIVVQLSSCVTQVKNNYKQTNADKIINCIKKMGEDRSLIGRHKICAEIYKQKD